MATQTRIKEHFPNKSWVVSIFYISDTSVLRENSSLVISYKTTSGIRVGYFLPTGKEIVDVIPGFSFRGCLDKQSVKMTSDRFVS